MLIAINNIESYTFGYRNSLSIRLNSLLFFKLKNMNVLGQKLEKSSKKRYIF